MNAKDKSELAELVRKRLMSLSFCAPELMNERVALYLEEAYGRGFQAGIGHSRCEASK